MHLIAERLWKEDLMVVDIEEMEKLDGLEVYVRTANAKEELTSEECENSTFPFTDGTAADLREELQGNSEWSQPTEIKDDVEANDLRSIEGEGRVISNPKSILTDVLQEHVFDV